MRYTILVLVALFSIVFSLSAQERERDFLAIPDVAPNDEKSMLEWALKIENGSPRLNGKDGPWSSPLHKALNWGFEEVSRTLIEKGSDIQVKDNCGSTYLHIAAGSGLLDIVKILVEKGSEINVLNRVGKGTSPLALAAQKGRLEVVQYLLEKGAKIDFGTSPLTYCSSSKCLEVYKLLINKGADIHYRNDQPLADASYNGYPEIVNLLLDAGANVNAISDNEFGSSPLHQAAINGGIEVAKVLIARGANVNAKTKQGRTPLYLASAKKDAEVMEFLKSRGGK
jgi:ankyrin repeat protein